MQIEIVKGDITKVKADIIVNAANNSLMGGGGVDGAIHEAGGPSILKECIKICEKQDGCNTGDVVITNAGNLKAKYIIHTVGPIWIDGKNNEAELLESCYRKSLDLAEEYKAESIAFPNISTGAYGYPKEKALEVAKNVISSVCKENKYKHVQKIIFVNYDDESYTRYLKSLGHC